MKYIVYTSLMPKLSSVYVCQQFGFKSSQFLGRCPECGTWNSLVEQVEVGSRVQGIGSRGRQKARGEGKITYLSEVEKQQFDRSSTGLGEFDRVLGGGIVPGSLVLVSGDPGIGKSTLLTQLALNSPVIARSEATKQSKSEIARLAEARAKRAALPAVARNDKGEVLYVAGEESAQQIKIRAERINPKADLAVLNETDVDVICETIKQFVGAPLVGARPNQGQRQAPPLQVIVDSIQTLETSDLNSVAGSVGQVRECAHRLQRVAKSLHVTIFLVGQYRSSW